MATEDVIRRITVQGRSEGLDKVSGDLKRVADAQNQVAQAGQATATVTELTSRRQLSAAQAVERLNASLDSTYRAQQQFERGQRLVNRAVEQGVIDAARQAELVGLLQARYDAATAGTAHLAAAHGGLSGQGQAAFHSLRSVTEQAAMGVPITQALTMQIGQLTYAFSHERGLTGALGEAVGMFGRLLAPLLPLVALVAAAGVAIAGMEHEINATSKTTVTFGDTAKAVFQVVRDSIVDGLQPAASAIAPFFASAWAAVVATTKTAGNAMIGAFVGAFDAVKATWAQLPAAMGDLVLQAAQAVVSGTETMINGAIDRINGLAQKLPEWARPGTLGHVGLGTIANPFAGAASATGNAASAAASGAMSTDYLGGFYDAVKSQAVTDALQRIAESAKKTKDGLSSAGKSGKLAFESLAEQAQRAAEATRRWWAETATGFLTDLRSSIMQGEGLWKSLGDAASKTLDRIVDKLLNDVVNALFKVNQAGSGGVLQSLFGSLLGGGGTGSLAVGAVPGSLEMPMSFAYNAAGSDNWRGGWTMVGEQGPERVYLPAHSRITPASESGGAGAPTIQVIDQRATGRPAPVETQTTTGPDGRQVVKLIVKDLLAGGELDREAGARWGVAPQRSRVVR